MTGHGTGSNGGHNHYNRAITDAQVAEAVEAYRAGASAADLAEQLGVTSATIHYHVRKAGVPVHRPRRASQPRTTSGGVRPLRDDADAKDVLASLLRPPEDWQADALCAQTDPESFFPEKGGSTREAKKVCLRCPVRAQCLEYALANEERFGVWGGMSEQERRRLVRNRVA